MPACARHGPCRFATQPGDPLALFRAILRALTHTEGGCHGELCRLPSPSENQFAQNHSISRTSTSSVPGSLLPGSLPINFRCGGGMITSSQKNYTQLLCTENGFWNGMDAMKSLKYTDTFWSFHRICIFLCAITIVTIAGPLTAQSSCFGPSLCYCNPQASGNGIVFAAKILEIEDNSIHVMHLNFDAYCSGGSLCSVGLAPSNIATGPMCSELPRYTSLVEGESRVFFVDLDNSCLCAAVQLEGGIASCLSVYKSPVELVLENGLLPLVECEEKWANIYYENGWTCDADGCGCGMSSTSTRFYNTFPLLLGLLFFVKRVRS